MQNAEQIIELLEQITIANEEMLQSIETVNRRVSESLNPTISTLESVSDAIEKAESSTIGFARTWDMLLKGFKTIYKPISIILGLLKIKEFWSKRNSKSNEEQNISQNKLNQTIDQNAIAQKNATAATTAHQKAINGTKKSTNLYRKAVNKLKNGFNKLTSAFGKTTKAVNKNASAVKKATGIINKNTGAIKKSTTASSKKMAQKTKTTKAINDQNVALTKNNNLTSESAIVTGKAAKAGAVQAGATTAQTVATKKLTFAQKALKKVMAAGPFALKLIAMMAIMRLIGPLINGIGNIISIFTR